MSAALQLLAEPTRMEILRLVWSQERSAGEIAGRFAVTFGAVSQHLGRLLAGGLVRRRREGKHLFYRAEPAALGPLAAVLEALWAEKLDSLKSMAEAEQRAIDRRNAKDAENTKRMRQSAGTRRKHADRNGRRLK